MIRPALHILLLQLINRGLPENSPFSVSSMFFVRGNLFSHYLTSMNEFLETICILDGLPQHMEWHQRRIETTFHFCMSHATPFHLEAALTQYNLPTEGKIKCSIQYAAEIIDVIFAPYSQKTFQHLKLVEIPSGYDYRFKFADRRVIDDLFSKKGNTDDILMTRGGWITDTSIANIAFRKNERWYTPSNPLLAGTTWKRLIAEGKLIPRPIHQSELAQLDGFKVFNAMNDWGEVEEMSCTNIFS